MAEIGKYYRYRNSKTLAKVVGISSNNITVRFEKEPSVMEYWYSEVNFKNFFKKLNEVEIILYV